MENNCTVELTVSGKVQGVNFRWFTVLAGRDLSLTGYAKNRSNGTVEVIAEGNRTNIEKLIEKVKQGPALSRVDEVEITWLENSDQFENFEIQY